MAAIVVGISDMKVAKPPDTLVTYALGSCVGICLWDPASHIAGLAHVMLPTAAQSPGDMNISKFADTAIPELIRRMEQAGAFRGRLVAKMAGGAQMFEVQGLTRNSIWQIGQRNVEMVSETLRQYQIPILGQDVLSNYGRTLQFNPESGVMHVKALDRVLKQI